MTRGKTRKIRRIKQKGGWDGGNNNDDNSVRVDVRQITITEPIMRAIESLRGNDIDAPLPNLSRFKKAPGHPGFALPRLKNIRGKNIRANLEKYPIEVKTIRNKNHKAFGILVDDVRKPIYTIINGRHRFAKAVAEGLETVNVIIID
jgi:hypothetical protein